MVGEEAKVFSTERIDVTEVVTCHNLYLAGGTRAGVDFKIPCLPANAGATQQRSKRFKVVWRCVWFPTPSNGNFTKSLSAEAPRAL